jgi:hypothetical protein
VVVLAGDGRPLGFLEGAHMYALPPVRWSSLAAGAIAEPLDRARTTRTDERADRFFSRYLGGPAAEYLVLDTDGRLAGVVDGPAVDRLRLVPGAPERRPDGRPAGNGFV